MTQAIAVTNNSTIGIGISGDYWCTSCGLRPCCCRHYPSYPVMVPYPVFMPPQAWPTKKTIELTDDEAKDLAKALRLLADKLDGGK